MIFASVPPLPESEPVTWWLWAIIVVGMGFLAGVLWGGKAFFKKFVIDSMPMETHDRIVKALTESHGREMAATNRENERLNDQVRAWQSVYHISDEASQKKFDVAFAKLEARDEALYEMLAGFSEAGQPHDNVATLDNLASSTELSFGDRTRRRRDDT